MKLNNSGPEADYQVRQQIGAPNQIYKGHHVSVPIKMEKKRIKKNKDLTYDNILNIYIKIVSKLLYNYLVHWRVGPPKFYII